MCSCVQPVLFQRYIEKKPKIKVVLAFISSILKSITIIMAYMYNTQLHQFSLFENGKK